MASSMGGLDSEVNAASAAAKEAELLSTSTRKKRTEYALERLRVRNLGQTLEAAAENETEVAEAGTKTGGWQPPTAHPDRNWQQVQQPAAQQLVWRPQPTGPSFGQPRAPLHWGLPGGQQPPTGPQQPPAGHQPPPGGQPPPQGQQPPPGGQPPPAGQQPPPGGQPPPVGQQPPAQQEPQAQQTHYEQLLELLVHSSINQANANAVLAARAGKPIAPAPLWPRFDDSFRSFPKWRRQITAYISDFCPNYSQEMLIDCIKKNCLSNKQVALCHGLHTVQEILTRISETFGGQFAHLYTKELMQDIIATPMLRNDDYINLESFYRKVLAALRDARDTGYMSVFGTSQKGEVFDRLPISEHRLWREYYDQHGNPFATEFDCLRKNCLSPKTVSLCHGLYVHC